MKLFGKNEAKALLQRVDELTMNEAWMTISQTLEVVHDGFQSIRVINEGE
jgi:hypothetical protein